MKASVEVWIVPRVCYSQYYCYILEVSCIYCCIIGVPSPHLSSWYNTCTSVRLSGLYVPFLGNKNSKFNLKDFFLKFKFFIQGFCRSCRVHTKYISCLIRSLIFGNIFHEAGSTFIPGTYNSSVDTTAQQQPLLSRYFWHDAITKMCRTDAVEHNRCCCCCVLLLVSLYLRDREHTPGLVAVSFCYPRKLRRQRHL